MIAGNSARRNDGANHHWASHCHNNSERQHLNNNPIHEPQGQQLVVMGLWIPLCWVCYIYYSALKRIFLSPPPLLTSQPTHTPTHAPTRMHHTDRMQHLTLSFLLFCNLPPWRAIPPCLAVLPAMTDKRCRGSLSYFCCLRCATYGLCGFR